MKNSKANSQSIIQDFEGGIKLRVALSGKLVRPLTKEERDVYEVLLDQKKAGGGSMSAVGLSRWIKKNPDLMKADKAIAKAADSLWRGYMEIGQDEDGNYFIS